jgi:hypothetical protein
MIRSSPLIEKLYALQQENEKLTGILRIKSSDQKNWQLYFCLGKLIWADGGFHIYRSWRRYLKQFCPQININQITLRDKTEPQHPHYHLLTILLMRKLIKTEQIKALISQKSQEIIFDILQVENKQILEYTYEPKSSHLLLKEGFSLSLALDDFEAIVMRTQLAWFKWLGKGLAACSPNLAPSPKNTERLCQETPQIIYQNMIRLLDGKQTLRDLALRMNIDVFELTCALMPYFFKGYVRLAEIQDISPMVIHCGSSSSSLVFV